MAISVIQVAERQPTHIKGLYRWSGGASDIGDVTGGSATINIRLQEAFEKAPSLWFYLTEIWWSMGVVTSQSAHLKITGVEWPGINSGADQLIGIPAPAMDADTFGGSAPVAAILPKPVYLGQPATETDVDLQIQTTNTDTMTITALLRGFATQYPIDPRPFWA